MDDTMTHQTPKNSMSFFAISRFVVANGMDEEVASAFGERPHLVDSATGFRSMRVLRGCDDSAEFWLLTEWDSEPDYKKWHRSHAYSDSHAGIPKGLKLVRGETAVHRLNEIAR